MNFGREPACPVGTACPSSTAEGGVTRRMEVKEEVNVGKSMSVELAAWPLRPTYQLGALSSSFHSDTLAVDTVCGAVMTGRWWTETEVMRET